MRYVKSILLAGLILGLAGLAWPAKALAHCQIPCGIYDDEMRFTMLAEHITTLEKSMTEIQRLSKSKKKDYHQLNRWVVNKEQHAEKLQRIVSDYFLSQRLKPAAKNNPKAHQKYTDQLTLLHQLIFHAMKTKQTTDRKQIQKLRSLLADYRQAYFAAAKASHTHKK